MTGEECAATVRPPPVAGFAVEPTDPAAGDPVRLIDLSYDPAGDGIALHAWDLGDGATSVEPAPTHRYGRDGTYRVMLHITARDGRVASSAVSVTVATHDVAITRIRSPRRARAGEPGRIVVTVVSRHRAEIAQIELFRHRGHGWRGIGIQTFPIPAGTEVDIVFAVAFNGRDAEARSVTFCARATLVGADDATPEDNAMTAPPTLVADRR